jgi:hypothetical protein
MNESSESSLNLHKDIPLRVMLYMMGAPQNNSVANSAASLVPLEATYYFGIMTMQEHDCFG